MLVWGLPPPLLGRMQAGLSSAGLCLRWWLVRCLHHIPSMLGWAATSRHAGTTLTEGERVHTQIVRYLWCFVELLVLTNHWRLQLCCVSCIIQALVAVGVLTPCPLAPLPELVRRTSQVACAVQCTAKITWLGVSAINQQPTLPVLGDCCSVTCLVSESVV